jgi:iron complex transport system substrate-binding protein
MAQVTLGAATLAVALTSCHAVDERAHRAPGERATFVSLNPCTDAILARVADPDQVLALSHYSHDPRATSVPAAIAQRFGTTGGTVEEVLALAPDVILADPFLQPATRHAFERLALRVETFDITLTVAESHAQVRRIAALAGHPVRGEALIVRTDAALAAAAHRGPGPSALLWQQGGLVAGRESLAARLLTHTGFANHADALGLRQGAYLGLERVLIDPPDLIIAAGGERLLAHPAVQEADGLDYRSLDPRLLFCGGPSIIEAVERLAAIRAGLGNQGARLQ